MASLPISDIPCQCAGILFKMIPVSGIVAIIQAYIHTPPDAEFWLDYLSRFDGIYVNANNQEITCDEAEDSEKQLDYVHIQVGFANGLSIPLGSGTNMYMFVDVSITGTRYHIESVESWNDVHEIKTSMTHVQFPFYNCFEHGIVKRNTIQELFYITMEQRRLIGIAVAKLDRRLKKIYGELNNAALLHRGT